MPLTDAQRATRIAGLGGSESLAYCGKDPRCSPLQLYLRKIGEQGERPTESPREDWGVRLEPVVRDWLAEVLGREIEVPTETIVSPEHPYLFGNLDGIVKGASEGVEIKTGDKFTTAEFGEVGTDQVPVRYGLQCMHYMLVTGFKRFHIGVLLGGNDARHYIVNYDPELANMLVSRAQDFWGHVVTRTPPDPVNLHDADKRWPRSTEKVVEASERIVLALTKLKELRAEEATVSKAADSIELGMKAYMGDAAAITDAKGKPLATWRSQNRESFDSKSFIEAYPDLAAQYRRTSNFRVFRLR